ncbi:uncharacterized protein LOC124416160 isoform X1 [Diprion similis]|uniref:uncharacterized protein LOC124416160 isoform X1 n=1 Tax=Diprion similis TaxID=362088 RepID=UPI001EF9542E|nr:uncharacterized protein LOC124416160 isoform X1 [Diprion similis]
MSQIQIKIEEVENENNQDHAAENVGEIAVNPSWHIPRPSLVGRSERGSENGSWGHLHTATSNSSSRGSTSSQGSTASTHSAASGTLLLTAANLATLAALYPPTVTSPKPIDTASVASSTHFTVVNGLGRPTKVYKKSWCARNQLTVLICTMSFLFMVGLLAGVLYMEMRARDKYN